MFKRICSLFSLLVLLVSCGTSEVSQKDVLVIGVPAEAVSLYPYGSNDNASARVLVQIYDRLVEKNEDGTFRPSLATAWEFISSNVLQMKLREGVLFHNGDGFSAQDVKYSLETMIKSPEVEHIASPIKQVDVIDDYTVQIVLHAPFAPILSHLSHPVSSIINKKAIDEAGQNVRQTAVGTGPFKLVQWNRGQNIVLERNDQYWGGLAAMATIEFRTISEASSRTIALETGDIDIAYDIDAVDLDRVKNNSELTLIERAIPRIEYIGFNMGPNGNAIWKDVRVREAVALVLDIQGIIDSVIFGAATPADSIIYKSVIGHYNGLKPYQRNVEKAKQLIAEAGVPQGTKVVLWTTEGQRQKIMEVVQANLAELGFDSEIKVFEWGRYLEGTAKGEHDIFILGWTTVTGDADYGIYNLVHTKSWGAPGNRSFYSNPEVDTLLDQARVEVDEKKRNALYQPIQEILYKELPFIPLYYKMSNVGTSSKVQNFVFDITDSHHLFKVSVK